MQHEVGEHGSKCVVESEPERWTQPDVTTLVIAGFVQEVGQFVRPNATPCDTVAIAIMSKICEVDIVLMYVQSPENLMDEALIV